MKRISKTADPSYDIDVYLGRERAGSIRREGSRFRALDSDENELGEFASNRDATAAILAKAKGRLMNELAFHALASVFPLVEGADLEALVDDIAEHGLREPIAFSKIGFVIEQVFFDDPLSALGAHRPLGSASEGDRHG